LRGYYLQKKTKASKGTPAKGAKALATKKGQKAGTGKASSATPNGKKGASIKVKKTPVSVRGGVKKGKGKATPMAIDSRSAGAGTNAQRNRKANGNGVPVKVKMVGGKGMGSGMSKDAGVGRRRTQRTHISGETGKSISARFERIAREKGGASRSQKQGRGTTNSFGVYMPF